MHVIAKPRCHCVCFQISRSEKRIAGRVLCIERPVGSLTINPAGLDFAADADQSLDILVVAVDPGRVAHGFSGPMLSRWVVPQDYANTMFIELRHLSETEGVTPAWWADPTNMVPGGQLAAESYEAGQRQPGDYEAQVSQRPIAIHALEHIGATDRVIMMFRNQTRRGIRAVQTGCDPVGLCRDAGKVIPTYCNDTVVGMAPDSDPMIDRQHIRETGRRLAESYLAEPPLLSANTAHSAGMQP
ncbi:MAG TPA: hypothetical protein VGR45_07835 [Stellaceae bacterium]|nr:hypothetical protein [Stellaceae bacterium]